MPRTQTTGVIVSVQARATMARTEIKGLRKDISEFAKFTRDSFRGIGGNSIPAPRLAPEWRQVEREVLEITGNIERAIGRISGMRIKPLGVGSFLGGSARNAAAAVERAATMPFGGVGAGAGGAGTGPVGPRSASRQIEIAEAARLTREWQAGTLALDDYEEKLQEIARTATSGSEKQIDALKRVRQAQKAAASEAKKDAEQRKAASANRLDRFGQGAAAVQKVGDGLTVGVTAPLVAGFTAAAKEAISYDAALRNVNSIAQVSEKQFGQLYKQVIKIADDPGVVQGPTDLAKALYELQSSGFDVSAAMNSPKNALTALKVASRGATAGLTDTTTASNGLIAVLNSGIGGVGSAEEAMNLLFQTVNDGKVSFAELSNSVGAILPTATKAGLTFQEVGAAVAYMTVQGQSGSEATNDLLNLITKIANPGEQAEKQFRALGISFGFSGLQAKGLPGILEEINKKTGGNADQIKRLLPDMQAQRAALSLLKNDVKDYNKFIDQQAEANKGVGATQRALSQQQKSYQYELDKLRQQFQKLAVEIGPALIRALRDGLTAIKPFLDGVKDLAEQFSKLTPEQQQAVIKTLAFAAATGPVLSGLGRMGGGIVNTIRLFNELRPAATGVATVMSGPTATGVAAVGTSATTAAGPLSRLTGLLNGLKGVGKVGLQVAIAIVGAEALGQAVKWLDKLAGGGLAKFLGDTADMYAGKDIGDHIRKNGVPTLFEGAGMLMDAGKTAWNAKQRSDANENAPWNVANREEQQARGSRQRAYQASAGFAKAFERGGTPNYNERLAIAQNFSSRGIKLPTLPSGAFDWHKAAQLAAHAATREADRQTEIIKGAQNRQYIIQNDQRRTDGARQFGGDLGRLTPGRGVYLAGMDNRSKNVVNTLAKSGAGGRIVSNGIDKNGRRILVMEGVSGADNEQMVHALANYGIKRVQRGESVQSVTNSVSAKQQGNRLIISIAPGARGTAPPAQRKKKNTGVVQPGARPGRGNKRVRSRATIINESPLARAENAQRILGEDYGDAFRRYEERARFMSEGDRGKAQKGLFALANRIETADQAVANAKLNQATLAKEAADKEAARLDKAAKTAEDHDRADEMRRKAAVDFEKAEVIYKGEMAEIQRRHSQKYRDIYRAEEGSLQEIAERRAKAAEAEQEVIAQGHERRAREIEDQLKYEQDSTKREAMIAEKMAEIQKAIDARYAGAMAAAKGIKDKYERDAAVTRAGADKRGAEADLALDRSATTTDEALNTAQRDIAIMEQQAEAIDDLTTKHQALLKVEEKRLDILRQQGATKVQIDAQAKADERAAKDRQAAIARENAEALLIRSRTEGMEAFAPAGTSDENKARKGAEEFRKQLTGIFTSEFNDTAAGQRGGVVNQQIALLSRAVELGLLSFQQIIPVLGELEKKVNSTGNFEASNSFYKVTRDVFGEALQGQFTALDRLKGTQRLKEYNALLEGIKSGVAFGQLSEAQKAVIAKVVEERRDNKDPNDPAKKAEKPAKPTNGWRNYGGEAAKDILKSAEEHSADFIAAIFGNKERGQKAIDEFWSTVKESGQKALGKAVNDAILKPIGRRIEGSLKNIFERGADDFDKVLGRAGVSLEKVFKNGVGGMMQAGAYISGVLALSGQQGRRGKKGGVLGAVAGVGLGIATGGAGLALVGAGLTGASAGARFANGDILGGIGSIGSAYMPGGALAKKAGGGGVSRGMGYIANEFSRWEGPEVFVPNTDGMIIPSATAIGRLPTVAKANNDLLEGLSAALGAGGNGNGDSFTFNDYGDKVNQGDTDTMIRKFTRSVRDTQNRKS